MHIKQTRVSEKARKAMKPDDQQRLQRDTPKENLLTIENLEKHDRKHTTGPCELRQFGCPTCKKYWWRTVLKSKPVSRCRTGKCGSTRYDALPRNKEFGIGRFVCPSEGCGKVFYGYCEATERLKCWRCGALAKPHIHPKWKKRGRKRGLNAGAKPFSPRSHYHFSGHRQGDPGPHFETSDGSGEGFYAYGEPPLHDQFSVLDLGGSDPPSAGRSKHRRQIFNASASHKSTGGTESTFLTQQDEEEEVDLSYDIDDHEEKIDVCNFECDCGNKYTSKNRMKDQAKCYKCGEWNNPSSWAPPGDYERKSNAPHSCSRCGGEGHCLNLAK